MILFTFKFFAETTIQFANMSIGIKTVNEVIAIINGC